jgi:hypothetical protein
MSEWWSYRPSDLLMFSPRIYWRLFEAMNQAAWPLQLPIVGAALGWWLHASRGAPAGLRVSAAALALAWAGVGWCFLAQRYAPINWAAHAFAVAFGVQAAGLMMSMGVHLQWQPAGRRRHVGSALMLWALLMHPLLAWADARPWQQAEVFGFAPDPTAIATLGWLLWLGAGDVRARLLLRALWVVPLVWCAVSTATLWTMGAAQAVVPAAAALLALAAALTARARPLDASAASD